MYAVMLAISQSFGLFVRIKIHQMGIKKIKKKKKKTTFHLFLVFVKAKEFVCCVNDTDAERIRDARDVTTFVRFRDVSGDEGESTIKCILKLAFIVRLCTCNRLSGVVLTNPDTQLSSLVAYIYDYRFIVVSMLDIICISVYCIRARVNLCHIRIMSTNLPSPLGFELFASLQAYTG